ncbi:MAG: ammonium transporter, partial [Ruminococcus sp.]|nr:ammonium transporter [Ruminococcus sp.]
NLMDFCIGTVVFILIGASLLLGEDSAGGFAGKIGFGIITDYANYDWASFVFNMVFCATTATIVSGAMAERTKFLSYCVYSAVISAVVYPIEAHWIWGGGWLAQRGFHDFAGSTAIHMVGGISALIGAAILGPRIGKFIKKDGKVAKVNAFPGHNLVIGALGVFILWFGWYGFNGAAATTTGQLASIFMTTTIAPAIATVVCMIFTWVKYGKPDVSMCLNASLAGLVGVTAGCDALDAIGATVVGIVSGILVVVVVEVLDMKLHVDDPVGAVGVHMANGIWGTIAVGLLANPDAPAGLKGLFYTGDFTQLGLQLLGFVSVAGYAVMMMIVTFIIIKKTIGLRASAEEEIMGLDITEHGLPSAYAGFAATAEDYSVYGDDVTVVLGDTPVAEAVEVKAVPSVGKTDGKFTKIEIICKEARFEKLKRAMAKLGITGMTVTHVMGYGAQKGKPEYYRGVPMETNLLPKLQVEMVVSAIPVRDVVETAKKALYTGHIGDGKIFVYDVENVVKIRTGEEGYDALQGD